VSVLGADLDRDVVGTRRVQHAEHGELKVIHALEGQVES